MSNKALSAILISLMLSSCEPVPCIAHEALNTEKLADAIFKAEHSKAHPYGIMTRYKHTTPRQACINTINRAFKDWLRRPASDSRPFIAFLGARYAPTQGNGLRPAERRLNRFWVQNVTSIYERSMKP